MIFLNIIVVARVAPLVPSKMEKKSEAVNSLQVVQSIIQSISALVLPCALVTRLLPSSLGYSIWLLPSQAVKQVEATGMVGMMSPIDHELNNYLSFFRARRRREARAPPVNERGGSRSRAVACRAPARVTSAPCRRHASLVTVVRLRGT